MKNSPIFRSSPGSFDKERLLRNVRFVLMAGVFLLFSCSPAPGPVPAPQPAGRELVLYGWGDDIPKTVLDAFYSQSGYRVVVDTYPSQEEAIKELQAGRQCDLLVMDNELIPKLVENGLAAEINFHNIPNFKNISPGFRDLQFDPGNRHSIPLSWGATGLVARTDLTTQPVKGWKDLWDPAYRGKVELWPLPRYVIGLTLQSLGYSINTEDPQALEAALKRLQELAPNVYWGEPDATTSAPDLVEGKAVLALGWMVDAATGKEKNPNIAFVIPDEGTILWGDNFIIPTASRNKPAAELFLNFFLQPQISAEVANQTLYAVPNDAARPLIRPEILNDRIVYNPQQMNVKFETILPLSPQGEKLYNEVWERFSSLVPQK
jgi:spermidine/putrescine transport system substrate-binding protein